MMMMKTTISMGSEERRIDEDLAYMIILMERVRSAAKEAESFKNECFELGKQMDYLSQMLRLVLRFVTSTSSFYGRPLDRITFDISKNLYRTVTLIRKCTRRGVFHRMLNIIRAADFRKVTFLLDDSISDTRWLLGLLESLKISSGTVLTLPPIARNDPIIAWVWSYIASVQMGQLSNRIEAARVLSSHAKDSDRGKKIIVKEGGIPPLLKLLKESTSTDGQLVAATALFHLAYDRERVRIIVEEHGVPVILRVLGDSPMAVQIHLANLVARMAEYDSGAQEDFAREKAIKSLVSLLSDETFADVLKLEDGKQNVHGFVQIDKDIDKNLLVSTNHTRPFANSFTSLRKEEKREKPETKLELKISCAKALWMLARGSVPNSRRIAESETNGLLCLAKVIENEEVEVEVEGDLLLNCLMTIMEITAAAKSNASLRKEVFKTNSPAAKAIVDQLLRVIKETKLPEFQIPAIKSIGSLARSFPARETHIIAPLITKLIHKNQDIATEAAAALCQFASSENFLHMEHSKAIIELNGVPPLMKLLRANEKTQSDALILLCFLAIHAGNSEAMEHARVLTTLECADRSVAAQHPKIRDLVSKAIYQLNLYHIGVQPQRQPFTK